MHNENAIHYMEKKWNSTNLINDKNQNPSKMLTMHQVFIPLPQVRASKSWSPNPASLPADAPFMSALNPHP